MKGSLISSIVVAEEEAMPILLYALGIIFNQPSRRLRSKFIQLRMKLSE
jgi:hypothetical protein